MGGFFSLAGVGFVQNWHHGSRSERYSKLGYELDIQGLKLDVLGTVREEIRDQVFVIISSLDNLMVVATLMLSLGFGFVVEGTFPPHQSEALRNWKIESIGFSMDPLVIYAILCALSLVCPFWCLVLCIRMRYEVDLIIREHMHELKRQLWNVLRKEDQLPQSTVKGYQPPETQISTRRILGTVCPRRLKQTFSGCPQRQQHKLEKVEDIMDDVTNMVAQQVGPSNIGNDNKWIQQEVIVKWAGKDLLHRAKKYHFYLKWSHVLLWIGMLSCIFTCALLLGMYMQVNFPHTPLVWKTYSGLVGINGGLAIVFALWMWLSGTTPLVDSTKEFRGEAGSFDSNDSTWCDISRFRSNSMLPLRTLSQPFLEKQSSVLQPFLEKPSSVMERMRMKAWNARSSPACEKPEPRMTLRVRDASRSLDAFRQVRLPSQGDVGDDMSLETLQNLICNKFRAAAHESGACSVSTLVRMRDRLEIIDSMDVAELEDGDELEVAFTDVFAIGSEQL
jgi:hypothetical protein